MSNSTKLSTLKTLPFDEQDWELLRSDDLSYSLALNPHYRPNWSHVYIYRKDIYEHYFIWKKYAEGLRGKEFMTLYAPKCELVYLFISFWMSTDVL